MPGKQFEPTQNPKLAVDESRESSRHVRAANLKSLRRESLPAFDV